MLAGIILSSDQRNKFYEFDRGFRLEFDRGIEFRHLFSVDDQQKSIALEARTGAVELCFPTERPPLLQSEPVQYPFRFLRLDEASEHFLRGLVVALDFFPYSAANQFPGRRYGLLHRHRSHLRPLPRYHRIRDTNPNRHIRLSAGWTHPQTGERP